MIAVQYYNKYNRSSTIIYNIHIFKETWQVEVPTIFSNKDTTWKIQMIDKRRVIDYKPLDISTSSEQNYVQLISWLPESQLIWPSLYDRFTTKV